MVLRHAGLSHYCFGAGPTAADLPTIHTVSSLWADQSSAALFHAHLMTRVDQTMDRLPEAGPEIPYVPGVVYRAHPEEIVLDGGAFDGDTLQQWVDAAVPFAGWFGVEPHPVSARRFVSRVKHLPREYDYRICLAEVALGAKADVTWFPEEASLGATGGPAGHHFVGVTTIDALLATRGVQTPTLIKLDVEGAELEALYGARSTITTHRPVVAACVYHTPQHLWEIPMFLHDLMPDAKLYLRPHMAEGWDTVCYAVPPERAL
jgi:FkbM family methyltransferase